MIIHILHDGTTVESIEGHVVMREDVKAVYALLDVINKKGVRNGAGNKRVRQVEHGV